MGRGTLIFKSVSVIDHISDCLIGLLLQVLGSSLTTILILQVRCKNLFLGQRHTWGGFC